MVSLTEQILGQHPDSVLQRLRQADQVWQKLRTQPAKIPQFVKESSQNLGNLHWDVVVSGGTLGILIAASLQQRGFRVVVLERGKLRGRDQEWNISRQELLKLREIGLLSEEELENAIASEYNPTRVTFHQGIEIWVNNVLNIGVDPVYLLETVKQKFLAAGGTLLENTPLKGVTVHPDGVALDTGETPLSARLLLDAMGHFSPIVQQARQGEKPQGICLVVGSCATGYSENTTGDLMASFTPIDHQCQYFWEAFPAKDGRTTYLFTYLDADPQRFSLEFLMEEYLRLLPQYQNIELSQLEFKRFLFGFFPAYRNSPITFPWSRILPIGDSSGGQSPVSFGGFGSMVRHLKRLTLGIEEALTVDLLDQKSLALLQPYQPNIMVTWLFQRTMSVQVNQEIDPNQINGLLTGVFQVMDELGEGVLKPFLQDVVRFSGLAKTLPRVNPKFVLPILPQVGLGLLLDWLFHYINLALYTAFYALSLPLEPWVKNLSPRWQYYYHRWRDGWQYGAGLDEE
ncbi:FAD-dependent oxidoreductase [Spirulina subsalsa]|uniref:FAD-dependent oxidoreductase n=1 Tax=Spirulina subsalsa TaxID=54311 RepID=UPI00030238A9|nr:FAD-dependent oxidoreductase [Spirulina subsalsa]